MSVQCNNHDMVLAYSMGDTSGPDPLDCTKHLHVYTGKEEREFLDRLAKTFVSLRGGQPHAIATIKTIREKYRAATGVSPGLRDCKDAFDRVWPHGINPNLVMLPMINENDLSLIIGGLYAIKVQRPASDMVTRDADRLIALYQGIEERKGWS